VTDFWDAAAYDKLSDPQYAWGARVLERLPLAGDERVVDAGCGSGRLTALLAERLPRGRVIAIDRSQEMLETARAALAPRFGARIAFVRADVSRLPLDGVVDAVFSTATMHWVLDHVALFRALHRALRPGGRLVAQCGGGPNVKRLADRALRLQEEPPFATYFAGDRLPWHFADEPTTAARLAAAGFDQIAVSLEPQPTRFPDAAAYAAFVAKIILRTWLERLPDLLARAFLDEVTRQAAADSPPFELDYWRLNLQARRA
jgi:trans-aconitate methyltransferase